MLMIYGRFCSFVRQPSTWLLVHENASGIRTEGARDGGLGVSVKGKCGRRNFRSVKATAISESTKKTTGAGNRKRCLRCGEMYTEEGNSPTSCSYHGHMTGDKGMFSLAPPHQGIDGEWTEDSGIIVYKWNDEKDRSNTGHKNWKRRWTCCGIYDENAVGCRRGPHVSYDDGFTLFT
ncbi:hypothetical protein R1sor_004649 [Riccia sorocarpa]|uniref:Uncharacterized protein n=1 Tax=Riccia sorocarpa TaxID=122646 RepID=A0ABD3HHU8_9MARC